MYVCDACGTTEAVLAYMKQESPLSQWAAFQPRRPEGDFKAMPARGSGDGDCAHPRQTRWQGYTGCAGMIRRTGNGTVWRHFESCPGLTELWPEPFQAKYMAADGAVLVRFKTDAEGNIHMAADTVEK